MAITKKMEIKVGDVLIQNTYPYEIEILGFSENKIAIKFARFEEDYACSPSYELAETLVPRIIDKLGTVKYTKNWYGKITRKLNNV